MGQSDNSSTGQKSTNWTLIAIFGLTILNFSSDFLIEYQIMEYSEGLIYGIITGGLLIGLYSIRFFKKGDRRPFDYLKIISILLIAHYPFIYLYATEPWDNAVRVISLYIPATIYIYDKFVLGPRTTKPVLIFSVIQTVLIGLLIFYTQTIIEAASEVQRQRVEDWEQRMVDKGKADKLINEANQRIIELERELENCR